MINQDVKNNIKTTLLPLPEMLRKYFWDCRFEELSMSEYAYFISERILNFGNIDSVRWLLGVTDSDFIMNLVETSRNLDKKTKNYWRLIYDEEISS